MHVIVEEQQEWAALQEMWAKSQGDSKVGRANVGRAQMRHLAVLSHKSAGFTVDWSKVTQL